MLVFKSTEYLIVIQGLIFENARRATNYPPGVAQAC